MLLVALEMLLEMPDIKPLFAADPAWAEDFVSAFFPAVDIFPLVRETGLPFFI